MSFGLFINISGGLPRENNIEVSISVIRSKLLDHVIMFGKPHRPKTSGLILTFLLLLCLSVDVGETENDGEGQDAAYRFLGKG